MYKFYDQENYDGNIEYKTFIQFINIQKKQNFISQLKFRLREGNGKAIYIIGITDFGELFATHIKMILPSINNFKLVLDSENLQYKYRVFVCNNKYTYCIFSIQEYNLHKFNIDTLF